MGRSYKQLKDIVFKTTDLNLPETPLKTGESVWISRVNPQAFANDDGCILATYLGDGDCIISDTQTTSYKESFDFVGGLEHQLTELRNKADQLRKIEFKKMANKIINNYPFLNDGNHSALKQFKYRWIKPEQKAIHVDLTPDNRLELLGGLVKLDDEKITQFFWHEETAERFELSAYRTFLNNGQIEQQPNFSLIPPSFHVHQVHYSGLMFTTVGFENALQLKAKYPLFSVVEFFCLEHLKNYQALFNLGSHPKITTLAICLNSAQLIEFKDLMGEKHSLDLQKNPLFSPVKNLKLIDINTWGSDE